MTIAARIRAKQDVQKMTYRSICILRQAGQSTADLEEEWLQLYGIPFDEYANFLADEVDRQKQERRQLRDSKLMQK